MTAAAETSAGAPARRAPGVPGAVARSGEWLFRHRGWVPAPVVLVLMFGPNGGSQNGWLAGGAAMAAGEALRLWGVAAAGPETRRRTRSVSSLVTHGPFAFARNPIYTGNFLLWLGFAIASRTAWFVAAAAALFTIEYGLIVRFEERVLGAAFGEQYEHYVARTPRWLPRWPATRVAGRCNWALALRREAMTVGLVAALVLTLVQRRSSSGEGRAHDGPEHVSPRPVSDWHASVQRFGGPGGLAPLKMSRLICTYCFMFAGTSSSGKIAVTGHSGSHAPQSMHSSGWM